jgi:hypothetical protein|tara:strand:- start:31 stop:207 length:177 start_codon:yes stop_codon:yes gene_type:complete
MKRILGLFAKAKLVRVNVKRRMYNFIYAVRAWLKMEFNHSTHDDLCIYYKKSLWLRVY